MTNPQNPNIDPNLVNAANQAFSTQQTILRDIFDKAADFQEKLKEQLATIKEINKEGGNQFELQDKLDEALTKQRITLGKINDLTDKLQSGTAKEQELEKKIVQGFESKRKLSDRLTELRAKELKLAEITAGINNGTITDLTEQQNIISSISRLKGVIEGHENRVAELTNIIQADQADLVVMYGDQAALLGSQLITLKEQEEVDKNLVQNTKAKLKFAQANNDANKDYIEYLKKQLQLTDKQKESLKSIGSTLKINSVLETLTLAGLIKGILELDQATTDFARNLGISRENAEKLTSTFQATQYNAKNLNSNLNAALFTLKAQVQANNELNASLGTGTVFTDKQVADQVFLTKQLGLQSAEAANLLKLGLLNSQSTESVTNSIGDQVVQLRQETGITLNFRKVLSDVAKVSGQLAAQYKNNPKLLAQAVIQAQKLGLTLDETAKSADSLLDFETSIENELKAELLLGRQLNFERARALALQGDSAAAAADLIQQAGGLSSFQELNVIQQRALADSVGLTADEMADALKQQKMLQETGFGTFEQLKDQADSIKDQTAKQQFLNQIKQTANGEQLVKQYEQVSLQEKFNALIETLQTNILKLAEGPVGTLLHNLTDMLTKADALKNIFRVIGGIIAFNIGSNIAKLVATGIPGMIRGAKLFSIQMRRGATMAALSSAFAGNIAGILGGLAAFAIAEAAIGKAFESGEGGGGGGGITSSSPTGGGVSTSATVATANVANNREQVALLNKINNTLEKQNQKPLTADVKVNIAGKDLRDLNTAQAEASTKNLA
jgi:nucleoid DNA-binding protein